MYRVSGRRCCRLRLKPTPLGPEPEAITSGNDVVALHGFAGADSGGPRWPRPKQGAEHAASRPCGEPSMWGAGRAGSRTWRAGSAGVAKAGLSPGRHRPCRPEGEDRPPAEAAARKGPAKPRIRDVRGQADRSGLRHPKAGQIVTQGKKQAISIGQFAGLAYLAARLGPAPAPELPGAHSGDMAYPPWRKPSALTKA
jgi:hypothetical protein